MGSRILVADDCQPVRESIAGLLRRAGHEIVGEASDGSEAVALTASVHPDVAILDLVMPGLDGLSAARQIRESAPDVRLILLTVHAGEETVVAAIRMGFLGFVAKTDAAEDLTRAVREVLLGNTYLSLKPARALHALFFGEQPS